MPNTNVNDPGNNKGFFITSKHSKIAESLGPQYQGMLEANPYRGLRYNKSPWQNVLHWLGFRTEADSFEENMATQAAEYDAAIAQKAYDEQYNSAAMQAERMRNAGINPDISGGQGISPGEAASPAQDPSTPMQTSAGEFESALGMATQVASACLDSVSTAVGIIQSIQGVKRNKLDNTMQAIQNESGFQALADEILPYLIPPTNADVEDDDGNVLGKWKNNAYEMAKMFVGDMPKKMRSKFEHALLNRLNSAPGERKAYEEWVGRIKARKSTFREQTEFYDESDDILYIISDGLSDMNEKITKAMQKAQLAGANAQEAQAEDSQEYFETRDSAQKAQAENAQARNEQTYYNNLDASKQAESENTSNAVAIANNQMVEIMRESLNAMVKKLDSASKDGGVKGGLASVAMALISAVQLWISTQGAPSLSRSSNGSQSSTPQAPQGNFEIIRDPNFGW